MKPIRTVYVDRDGVKVKINASQFNSKVDTLWRDKAEPEKTDPEREALAVDCKELFGRAPRKDMALESIKAKIEEKLGEE